MHQYGEADSQAKARHGLQVCPQGKPDGTAEPARDVLFRSQRVKLSLPSSVLPSARWKSSLEGRRQWTRGRLYWRVSTTRLPAEAGPVPPTRRRGCILRDVAFCPIDVKRCNDLLELLTGHAHFSCMHIVSAAGLVATSVTWAGGAGEREGESGHVRTRNGFARGGPV